jgi:predicted MPP superfamily phosphohydrolase
MMKKIAILGSTGSIGTQALDLCRRHPDRYRVTALTARGSREKLFAQVREFRPEMAGLTEGIAPAEIPEDLKFCRWMSGKEALHAVASEVDADQVLVSIVGIAGLESVLDALEAAHGMRLLLCHHPEYFQPWVAGRKIELTLSGHAHGGQVRLFGIGLYSPHQGILPRYTSGIYTSGSMKLYASRGAGNHSFLPPRIFNRPEINLITLKTPSR